MGKERWRTRAATRQLHHHPSVLPGARPRRPQEALACEDERRRHVLRTLGAKVLHKYKKRARSQAEFVSETQPDAPGGWKCQCYCVFVIRLSSGWHMPAFSTRSGPEGDTRNKSAGDCVFLQRQTMFPMLEWGENEFICQPASAQMHLAESRAGRGQCWGGCCRERSLLALVSAHRCSSPRQPAAASCLTRPQTAWHAASMLPLYKPSFRATGLVFIHPTPTSLSPILPLQVVVEMH